MTVAPSVFVREGFGWRYEPAGRGVVYRVTDIKSRDGNLVGFVEVTADREGLPRFLTGSSVNLTGGRGKPDLAKYLHQRGRDKSGSCPYDEADWLAMVESLAQRVLQGEQEGDPFEWVGEDEPADSSPYIVERLVEAEGINYLFGPGDQGKSWIERAILLHVQLGIPFCGLAVKQMETLLVDYEAGSDTDARRVRAILRGMDLPFQRFRRWQPRDILVRQVKPLGRILAAEGIGLYGVDSAAHAAGSPGEHGSWEDAGLQLGRALKALLPAVPLVLDHVTGEGSTQKLSGRMQGGYRKHNDARRAWECRKAQEAENSWLVAGLYNTKGNNSVTWKPIGIRLDFESDVWGRATVVRFSRDDQALRDVAEHATRSMSMRDRITMDLQEHATATASQIAYRLKAEEVSVAAKLREMRMDGETRTVEAGGGRGKANVWALAEKVNTRTALKEISIQSGLGQRSGTVPKPEQGNVNKGESGDTASHLSGNGAVWWGDKDDEGEVF